MALSDCPKCWDTPCTCGHMGYTTIFHSDIRKAIKESFGITETKMPQCCSECTNYSMLASTNKNLEQCELQYGTPECRKIAKKT